MINIGNKSFSHIPASLQCPTSCVCVCVHCVCVLLPVCVCVCVYACPLCYRYNKSEISTIQVFFGLRCKPWEASWEARLFKGFFLLGIPSRASGWGKKGRQDGKNRKKGLHISSELCLPCAALLCDGPSSFKLSPN